MKAPAHVVVIGGGATGAGVTHDLALRGLRVTLLERGELTSGTTGRHHGLLHSGGRYAVGDRESATECIRENRIIRRIAPGSFEENGGLFVAVTDDDMDYLSRFLDACAACGIPATVHDAETALRMEPGLNPDVKVAVEVPDATVDPMRLVLRFFATAQRNGADLRTFNQVTGLGDGDRRAGPRPCRRTRLRTCRRPRGQRGRALVRADRPDGRCHRADSAVSRRAARRPGAILQPGTEQAAQARRR
jgi:glycerol-3-phosphate dehydrogenase